jgi:hypothetical protein
LGVHLERKEAIALLKELGRAHLLQPSWVLIEERTPNRYQLCVKGNYDLFGIENFLKNHALEFEDARGFLCIFKL